MKIRAPLIYTAQHGRALHCTARGRAVIVQCFRRGMRYRQNILFLHVQRQVSTPNGDLCNCLVNPHVSNKQPAHSCTHPRTNAPTHPPTRERAGFAVTARMRDKTCTCAVKMIRTYQYDPYTLANRTHGKMHLHLFLHPHVQLYGFDLYATRPRSLVTAWISRSRQLSRDRFFQARSTATVRVQKCSSPPRFGVQVASLVRH